MEQKNLSTINLSRKQLKDVQEFCKLNKIENLEEFITKCFIEGYEIEKYGLLNTNTTQTKIIEKIVEVPVEVIIEKPIIEYVQVKEEVIKEVPVEKVVEKIVEIIQEIPVEKIVIQEIIKEVPVEKVITKTEYITDETKVRELLDELERLRNLPPVIQVVEKEIIKEIPTVVEKTTVDLSKQKALEETIQKLRSELQLKNKEIENLNNTIKEVPTTGGDTRSVYLDGSNLNRTINRR